MTLEGILRDRFGKAVKPTGFSPRAPYAAGFEPHTRYIGGARVCAGKIHMYS